MFIKLLGPLEKDIQAWRRAVTNAKLQLEYQDDRLMNLELADSHGGPVWLHANAASEGLRFSPDFSHRTGAVRQLDAMAASLRKRCDEIQTKRRLEQQNAYPTLNRMTIKSNETVMKTWQVYQACEQLESDIKRLKSSHHT